MAASKLRNEPLPLLRRPSDMDAPPDFEKYTASLQVIQQPDRARSCGSADRDRRCLDPPPVLKLDIRDLATGEPALDYMKRLLWIVQCFLYTATETGQGEQIPVQSAGRILVRGNMVSNAQYVDLDIPDHNGESCYFCFPDLSFSTAGYYRLKFQWAWIDHSGITNHQVRSMGIMGYQISDVFRVYSARDFPSMLPMTPIALALKRHGLWIRGGIQRNRRFRPPDREHFDTPENEEEGNEELDDDAEYGAIVEVSNCQEQQAEQFSKRSEHLDAAGVLTKRTSN
ncbi:velvet factor-domain-containing protein [Lipomyces arxii]|uniref:velvet factor-domain-containing protein n=1 Tax=Lipomyces arxii TaxID=56418 RepID=UPI0034CFD82C